MAMNLNNHLSSHFQFFRDLITGDGDSAEKHRAFYDEYLAVMDLPADYYLETLEAVFIEHHLPQNNMQWRGQTLDMTAIEAPALMTIEGELDDITDMARQRLLKAYCLASRASEKPIRNSPERVTMVFSMAESSARQLRQKSKTL